MSRIRDAVTLGARAVYRAPVPPQIYTHALREARRALPTGGVQKRHAVDVEMIARTRCVWLDRHHADQGVIVLLHGGAFVSGPFAGDWEWLSAQAEAAGCAGLMIDYRAAPDHQHPVALDDVRAVIGALAEDGRISDGSWILAGQNAGGGLAVSLARTCSPRPAALVLMAPWLDLALENANISETDHHDPVHERRMHRAAAERYAGRTPLDDPELSPLNSDLAGLPPVHLAVGTRDLFLTDARVARVQLEEGGVEVRFREVNGRLGTLARLRRGEDVGRLLREQAAFIREVTGEGLSPRR